MPKSVLEAIKLGFWDFEPAEVEFSKFSASDAMPGTTEKLQVMAERVRRGLPLWHNVRPQRHGIPALCGQTTVIAAVLWSFAGPAMPSCRDASPEPADFRPTASWPRLQLRAEMLRRTREFFHQCGFLEVETPILSAETVVDRHLDPFSLPWGEAALRGTVPFSLRENRDSPLWLQTSPEAAMKRLLATPGCPKAIYQISRVFRRDEQGPLHNPEFTLLEWYRAGDSLDEGMKLTSDLCEALLHRGPAQRLSYRDAFRQYAGVEPHAANTAELMEAAASLERLMRRRKAWRPKTATAGSIGS